MEKTLGAEMLQKMIKPLAVLALAFPMFISSPAGAQQDFHPVQAEPIQSFHWPEGKRAAVSLSFDDGRLSQVDTGLLLFRRLGIKVTFFLESSAVEKRLAGWRQAVADGHEIGNHTVRHPCTGNYAFSLKNALESYNLQMMEEQLDGANDQIQKMLGVTPKTFAYPCGQKFVGRGLDVRSYVPLVADRFLVGRGYLDESPNDPAFCDLSQAMGTAFDGMDFSQMKMIVDGAAKKGRWVIFIGHEIGQRGFQITDVRALEELAAYLKEPANGIWLGTVEEIGRYIQDQRRNRQR
jgi:peptidoglycan/xylan/chitin deacetylase (PgdA/CDA1 family)